MFKVKKMEDINDVNELHHMLQKDTAKMKIEAEIRDYVIEDKKFNKFVNRIILKHGKNE